MAPVVGSRSTRASVGTKVVGVLEAIEKEPSWAVVGLEDFERADAVFSTPPVRVFSFEVSPSRR